MSEKPKQLEGKKVRLRPLTRDDLELRLKWVNDPEVQKMSVGVMTSGNAPEDMRAWFHLVSEDPLSEQWTIESLSGDGTYAGDIDLHSINPARKEAWIHPVFGEPAVREPDIRRDVFDVMIRYAFENKGLESLWAQIPNTDPVTLAVLKEIGFEKVEESPLEIFEGVNELTFVLHRHAFRTFEGALN